MVEKYIVLGKIDDVKGFVNVAMSKPYDIDLVSGRYVVDAKSIMGIFSLDLSKPICMRADSDGDPGFLDEIKPFLAE